MSTQGVNTTMSRDDKEGMREHNISAHPIQLHLRDEEGNTFVDHPVHYLGVQGHLHIDLKEEDE